MWPTGWRTEARKAAPADLERLHRLHAEPIALWASLEAAPIGWVLLCFSINWRAEANSSVRIPQGVSLRKMLHH
jgi:hypothetical protein